MIMNSATSTQSYLSTCEWSNKYPHNSFIHSFIHSDSYTLDRIKNKKRLSLVIITQPWPKKEKSIRIRIQVIKDFNTSQYKDIINAIQQGYQCVTSKLTLLNKAMDGAAMKTTYGAYSAVRSSFKAWSNCVETIIKITEVIYRKTV